MLLEVESLAIDQQATNWTTLVIRPMIIHVQVKVLQITQKCIAFDTVQWPNVILDLRFIVADL